ncbi:hypothetical protein [Rhizobium sp. Leaf383]|uniref:hypothetical protein n=1 Tax=Rhizobium sp. Leaf383 TaxID=1736357 RepID=UPI00071336FA|nr:hypothetical protein [Rhizobium sp. Leaf383]KQS84836.1 hypothetical protein ASG58_20300 [Rhizobium sp. Leaf383]
MAKKTTYRFPEADVLLAKAAIAALRDDLVAKAASETAPTFDLHVVFNVGKLTAGPAKGLAAELVDYPMTYLLYEPPGGATYAELLDVLFGAPRAESAERFMACTLLMLQMMARLGDLERPPLMIVTEKCFLGPLLEMTMAYSYAKVPQETVAVITYQR